MRFNNIAYGKAIKKARAEQGLKIGDLAAAFGVCEIEISGIERGAEPSQKFTERAAIKLGISYADYQIDESPTIDLNSAMDLVAKENVLPFPYRHRIQDDV